jgi:hypothetical protein
MGAYKVTHSLNKYLLAASVLVTINFTTFLLITNNILFGYYLGLFTSGVLAIGNGLIHFIGWLKTKKLRDGIGAGMFTGFPLAATGIWVLILLWNEIF